MPLVQTKRAFLRITIFALGASLLGAAVGCTKNRGGEDAASSPSAGANAVPAASGNGGNTTLAAAGKIVYASNGCARCHALAGQGGRSGPDLSHVGAESSHTSDWLVAYIKDPKTHNPGSRMLAFAGKITDKDLLALGAYLASLK